MGCSMHAAYKDISRFANSLTPLCAQLTESLKPTNMLNITGDGISELTAPAQSVPEESNLHTSTIKLWQTGQPHSTATEPSQIVCHVPSSLDDAVILHLQRRQ